MLKVVPWVSDPIIPIIPFVVAYLIDPLSPVNKP